MNFEVYRRLSTQAQALLWASLWTLLYVLLVTVLPPNVATMNSYDLSPAEFRILSILTATPTVVAWFTAFYGYAVLTQYASTLKASREGRSFTAIARGLKWLAWSLPLIICVNTLLGGIARLNPGFIDAALILSHYIYLLAALAAFTYMSDGTRSLRDIVNKLPSKNAIRMMIALCIVISVSYCTVTLATAQDQHPNSYRLPLWLILLTIIVPYLYAWLMGLFAVFEISQYRRAVRGLFYKQALRLLGFGMTCAIIASVALQYLTSSSRYLRRIDLNWRLLASYIIVITFAIGFILIVLGTAKLKKIEEV